MSVDAEVQDSKQQIESQVELFFFVVLGFEFRAYTLSYSTSPFFVMGFFEVGFCKLFTWAGFEP
jgi:hypothetical protein